MSSAKLLESRSVAAHLLLAFRKIARLSRKIPSTGYGQLCLTLIDCPALLRDLVAYDKVRE